MAGLPPAVGQIYRVTYDLTMFAQKLMTTFTYRLRTVGTEVDTDAMCTALRTALAAAAQLEPKYQAAIPAAVAWDNVWVQVVYPTRLRKLVFPKTVIGGFIGVANTPNLASSIERRGVLANRNNVGRVQLPAPDDGASVVAGSWQAGYLAVLATLGTQMVVAPVTAPGGSVFDPVLVRNPVNAGWELVIQCDAKTTARVMRRRTVGVGK